MPQTLPYSDERMTYDAYDHKYHMTLDHVRTALNVDLESRLNAHGTANLSTLAIAYLKRVSREVYLYIYNHNNQLLLEYLIAKSETARRALLTAQEEQLMYWLANGDIGLISGVDTKRGSYAEWNTVRRATIAPNAQSVLQSTILPETGCALTYVGHYGIIKQLPAYDEEGY